MGCQYPNFRKVVCLMLADQGLFPAPAAVDCAATDASEALTASWSPEEIQAVESALGLLTEQELETLAVGEQEEWPPLLERMPEPTHAMLDEIFMQIGG